MRYLRIVLPALRDSFWRAFWRRHQKYLPPAAQVTITGANVRVDKDAKVPAIHVETGRDWR
jgi:hypothetical protein